MTGTPPPSTGSFRLTPRFWIVLGIATVLIVAVVLAGVLYARAGNTEQTASGSTADARPVPSDAPGAETAPAPAPSPSIDPNDTRPRPADCSALFSSSTTDQIPDGFELNPAWSASPDYAVAGMTDIELMRMLASADKLACTWGSPAGPGGEFIRTDFAWITDADQQTVLDRLNALGYDCYDEFEGTRCTIDQSTDSEEIGESHFLRDGVWIASRWLNLAPNDYTRDIITNAFG